MKSDKKRNANKQGSRRTRRLWSLIALVTLIGFAGAPLPAGPAQDRQAAVSPLAFEVASIRPGGTEPMRELVLSGKWHQKIDEARVDLGSFALLNLIQMAYRIPDIRISGPGWLSSTRFDIVAKLPVGSNRNQVPEMLKTLLKERFHLVARVDPRLAGVYELVVDKTPLKLAESPQDDTSQNPCAGGRNGHYTCHKVSMADLAEILTGRIALAYGPDRPVVDATGVKGIYDFSLDYGYVNPIEDSFGQRFEPVPLADGLRKIGLRLRPAQSRIDYLVVDSVDRVPDEN